MHKKHPQKYNQIYGLKKTPFWLPNFWCVPPDCLDMVLSRISSVAVGSAKVHVRGEAADAYPWENGEVLKQICIISTTLW